MTMKRNSKSWSLKRASGWCELVGEKSELASEFAFDEISNQEPCFRVKKIELSAVSLMWVVPRESKFSRPFLYEWGEFFYFLKNFVNFA